MAPTRNALVGFVAVAVAIAAATCTPVRLDYLDSDAKVVLYGATSYILPIVRIMNTLCHPFRRAMVPIELEGLKREAVANMGGHDDFGTLTDWEAVEKWVQVADERAHLVGRVIAKGILISILTTHLAISKTIKDHPEILDEKIERPIFLSAYTRAGATFLYQVLADTFDGELVPTRSYEVRGGPLQLPHKPDRKVALEADLQKLNYLNPPMRLMHEWTTPEDPEEDSGWYLNTLRGVATPFTMPSLWHHLRIYDASSADINRKFWEVLLQIKQWKAGRKLRFIMKAPEHLFGLPYLSEAFPDAKFVTVSRAEGPMYRSGLALTHAFQRMLVHPRINETVAFMDLLICHERRALETAHGEEHRSRVMRVRFEDGLFADTFAVVARFAAHADLPWDDAKQAHAREVIAERLSWKKHKGRYRTSDFGIADDEVEGRLATVCEELPDTVEGLEEFYNLKL